MRCLNAPGRERRGCNGILQVESRSGKASAPPWRIARWGRASRGIATGRGPVKATPYSICRVTGGWSGLSAIGRWPRLRANHEPGPAALNDHALARPGRTLNAGFHPAPGGPLREWCRTDKGAGVGMNLHPCQAPVMSQTVRIYRRSAPGPWLESGRKGAGDPCS